MINISEITNTSFKIESAVLPRVFDATLNRFNDVVLRNIKTGYKINLGDVTEIKIDGAPATLVKIKDAVYNHSCNCEPGNENPVFKIFDLTFDPTFN